MYVCYQASLSDKSNRFSSISSESPGMYLWNKDLVNAIVKCMWIEAATDSSLSSPSQLLKFCKPISKSSCYSFVNLLFIEVASLVTIGTIRLANTSTVSYWIETISSAVNFLPDRIYSWIISSILTLRPVDIEVDP